MLPIIIVGVVGAVAAAFYKYAPVNNWLGKKIAILGARGVGKSYLINFLTTGSVPKEQKGTLSAEKTKSNRLQLEEINLRIKEGIDVTGTTAAYKEWKTAIDGADFIFYMFRVDELFLGNQDSCSRVLRDIVNIKNNWDPKSSEKSKSEKPLYLIGTHLDLIPEFNASENEQVNFIDKFKKLDVAKKMIGHAGSDAKWIFGSAKDMPSCEELALKIFRLAS